MSSTSLEGMGKHLPRNGVFWNSSLSSISMVTICGPCPGGGSGPKTSGKFVRSCVKLLLSENRFKSSWKSPANFLSLIINECLPICAWIGFSVHPPYQGVLTSPEPFRLLYDHKEYPLKKIRADKETYKFWKVTHQLWKPWTKLNHALHKICFQPCRMVLVHAVWQDEPWYTSLQKLSLWTNKVPRGTQIFFTDKKVLLPSPQWQTSITLLDTKVGE